MSIRHYNNRVNHKLFGMNADEDDNDLEAVFDEGDDEDDLMNEKQKAGSDEEELQRQVEQQQKQIDMLLAMMKSQQQQQSSRAEPPSKKQQPPEQPPTRRTYPKLPDLPSSSMPPPRRSSSPTSVRDFSSRTIPSRAMTSPDRRRSSPPIITPPQSSSIGVARASMSPLSAMLFIDGTWLYYSIFEREYHRCPIARKYGRFWKNSYYFDWAALPRVICTALHQQNSGWAVQSRPVEIVRASVFTSYKADTSPASSRFRMYQDMSNANYDVHMLTTVGKSEKCVDINIAVEMLHYATVPNAYDVAILLTGDKDFIPAMQRTRQKGKRVGLVSMRSGCNRALSEAPTDSNNNKEHNHNIRDYEVVWIDDHLDELIKPLSITYEESSTRPGSSLSDFTFMKILSDFITKSGLPRVTSRDVGIYMQSLELGDGAYRTNILEEIKNCHGSLSQFFEQQACFFTETKSEEEFAVSGKGDRSYWIGLEGNADVQLMREAKGAKLSAEEKQFLDNYSLDKLEDREEHYAHSLRLLRRTGQGDFPQETTKPTRSVDDETTRIIEASISEVDQATELAEEQDSELPEELTRDYSEMTVPQLKEYCRENELKVSGTKAELLARIQEHVNQQKEKLVEFPEKLTRDYSEKTVASLKYYCKEYELKVSGTKAELLERIQEYVNQEKEKFLEEHAAKPKRQSTPAATTPAATTPSATPMVTPSVIPSVTPEGIEIGYLEALVLEFVDAKGGRANSRDVGRYLAANKPSAVHDDLTRFRPIRGKFSALSELKARHGTVVGFCLDNPTLFEKLDMTEDERELDDPEGKHAAFWVVARQSLNSLSQQEVPQETQEAV